MLNSLAFSIQRSIIETSRPAHIRLCGDVAAKKLAEGQTALLDSTISRASCKVGISVAHKQAICNAVCGGHCRMPKRQTITIINLLLLLFLDPQ